MLDTSPAGSARGAALTADSELHGEVVDGRACFWVVTDNGAEAVSYTHLTLPTSDLV